MALAGYVDVMAVIYNGQSHCSTRGYRCHGASMSICSCLYLWYIGWFEAISLQGVLELELHGSRRDDTQVREGRSLVEFLDLQ